MDTGRDSVAEIQYQKMANVSPKVSIIVPIYNVRSYLAECMESLLNQDLDDYEIICVDDCSTDGSYELALQLAGEDPKIKVTRNEKNSGLSFARNRGLLLARGEYVWFVDADDTVEPMVLSRLYRQAKSDDLDILYFNYDIIYDASWESGKNGVAKSVKNSHGVYSGREMFCRIGENAPYMITCQQFLNRAYLVGNRIYFYDGLLHEDLLFFPLSLLQADRAASISDVIYHYRKRKYSITSKVTVARKQSMYMVLAELLRFWQQQQYEESVNAALDAYLNNILWMCGTFSDKLDENSPLRYGSAADRFLYKIVTRGERDTFDFTSDELRRMWESEGIWIYGAGVYGKRFYRYCRYMDIEVKGFAVTALGGNEKSVGGKPVCAIEQLRNSGELFVIAVSKPLWSDITATLKAAGCDNYLIARRSGEPKAQ